MPVTQAFDHADSVDNIVSKTLDKLTDQWLVELREAIIRADVEQMGFLIDQTRENYPQFAAEMAELVNNFEYKTIMNFIVRTGRTE
jgi:hypothetical protein